MMSVHFPNKSLPTNNNSKIVRAFHSKDYSVVLNYLFPFYNSFYHKKRKIYMTLPSKKASIKKDDYNQWREQYYQYSFKYNYSRILDTIFRHSEENNVSYKNIEGEDILKRTFSMKQYCDMFYKLK
jgi:hypothetical protein